MAENFLCSGENCKFGDFGLGVLAISYKPLRWLKAAEDCLWVIGDHINQKGLSYVCSQRELISGHMPWCPCPDSVPGRRVGSQ